MAAVALITAIAGIDGGPARGWDAAMAADKLTVAQWSWQASGDALWVILIGAVFSNALVPWFATTQLPTGFGGLVVAA